MLRRSASSLLAALALTIFGAAAASAQGQAAAVTLAEAHSMIAAAEKAAVAQNLKVSIVVVDARGDVIALGRMAGAGGGTPDIAIGKAMISAMFGAPSAAFEQLGSSVTFRGINDLMNGKLRFFQGALPIVRNGVVVGAIAGSGATSPQDEDIVKAGLTAFH
jgi:glc operon protein GlcG